MRCLSPNAGWGKLLTFYSNVFLLGSSGLVLTTEQNTEGQHVQDKLGLFKRYFSLETVEEQK